ncbi:MAG: hypothetical protein Q8N53_12515 [Longimicrobiales bacterium]|nr:hypothetical protein [Longimicrobiales bacterium]
MDTTWINIGGLLIRAPVNAGTNLLLAIQCLVYFAGLRKRSDGRIRNWGLFFLLMGAATLAGVAKHGFRHLLEGDPLVLVLALSNVATGFATYFAQRATLDSFPGTHRPLRLLIAVQLSAYLAANLAVGPEIVLLIANTLVGLSPVIAVEAARARTVPGSRLVAAGLSLSILTGGAYLGGFSPSRWFNHIDVAHLFMGVSFHMIWRGVAEGAGSLPRRASRRSEAALAGGVAP